VRREPQPISRSERSPGPGALGRARTDNPKILEQRHPICTHGSGSCSAEHLPAGRRLDLGTVIIGAFLDDGVKRVMDLPEEEEPMLIIPVGKGLR